MVVIILLNTVLSAAARHAKLSPPFKDDFCTYTLVEITEASLRLIINYILNFFFFQLSLLECLTLLI